LCFFTLPYRNYEDTALLEEEIRSYRGSVLLQSLLTSRSAHAGGPLVSRFFPSDADSLDHGTRHDIPNSLLRLIAKLVNVKPSERPNCDKILLALAEISNEVERNKLKNTLPEVGMVVRANHIEENRNSTSSTTVTSSTSSLRTLAIQVRVTPRCLSSVTGSDGTSVMACSEPTALTSTLLASDRVETDRP
jgi:hypothetical protein